MRYIGIGPGAAGDYLTSENVSGKLQGYYALLSPVYFSGSATTFSIPESSTGTFIDVEIDIDAQGTFDFRPEDMKTAQAVGHTGDGSNGSPIIFNLEGLSQTSSANVRASMSFNPDEDGGRLESRLLFNRHSGATPSGDFSIESNSIALESGANEEYSSAPSIQFFIGDTIDTNGVGDAGKCRLQVRSDVAGTVTVNEIAIFIQR